MVVGTFRARDFQDSESAAFFLCGMVVVMLNMLIAIMGDSYEKVKESEVVEARRLRAQTIIDEEALMSDADLANPDYFPDFLQVLRATEDKEVERRRARARRRATSHARGRNAPEDCAAHPGPRSTLVASARGLLWASPRQAGWRVLRVPWQSST